MKRVTNLSWPDRLALLKKYKPSDSKACAILGCTPAELSTARDLELAGSIVATTDLDTGAYERLFVDGIKNPKTTETLQSIVRDAGKGQPPLTATKKVAAPKKRGRKGDNIAKAFAAVPATPTDVAAFADTHSVSIAVLRQSKRFDKTGLPGGVRVKKDKASGTLQIWREAPPKA